MDLSLFQYDYSPELIAQHPLPERDASRMMVLNRAEKNWRHDQIKNITQYLKQGDLLILNDTKVFPARILGTIGQRGVEILLLNQTTDQGLGTSDLKTERWNCLVKPLKKIGVGDTIHFATDFSGMVTGKTDGFVEIEFQAQDFETLLEKQGLPPLPPYIKRKTAADYSAEDRQRYQSIFARHSGSAAAPTASLHFSEVLFEKIKARGVEMAFVTLHVSTDTFLPIREENVTQHKMHGEKFFIPPATQEAIKKARREKRRVIAVGTTAARALESDWSGPTTHLFITPGFQFKILSGLLTNFHQPGSTLILLVSALAGREFLLQAYREAIEERYRLFSYGDGMLIL